MNRCLSILLNIIIAAFASNQAFAADVDSADTKLLPLFRNVKNFHISRLTNVSADPGRYSVIQESIAAVNDRVVSKKSALTAMGMSAIVPGSGQLYAQKGNESLLKGAVFLTAEATGVILYLYNRNKGKKIERKYERYADRNWDVDKYLYFLEKSLNLQEGYLGRKSVGVEKDRVTQAEYEWGAVSGVSVHHLYKNTRQQYYEMIYKYPEQFALGWFDTFYDYDNPLPQYQTGYTYMTLTPMMTDYRSMRTKSNDYLSSARGMIGVLMINHVLSLADAAWTVKRKNKEEAGRLSLGFRLDQNISHNRLITMPSLRLTY